MAAEEIIRNFAETIKNQVGGAAYGKAADEMLFLSLRYRFVHEDKHPDEVGPRRSQHTSRRCP